MMLRQLIEQYSDDSLALEFGSVYQIWEDGEITLTKSGALLGQRTLHCMSYGESAKSVDPMIFPHQTNGHGFAYVTEKGAETIRSMILQ
jgi:hypothetical protein